MAPFLLNLTRTTVDPKGEDLLCNSRRPPAVTDDLAMQIETTRFGSVTIEAEDILLFPLGLFAFENIRHWVLLADAENESVGWLQSISDPAVALPVVSPRRFVPEYQIRIGRSQLAPLELSGPDQAYVLAVVGKAGPRLTVNLKAPLIINLDRRLGRQVITNDDQPLQLALDPTAVSSRKSA